MVSIALPKYGDFTVFTAASVPTAVSVLAEERIDCAVLADPLLADSERELRAAVDERGTTAPSRITTDADGGATPSQGSVDSRERIVTDRYVELVARIEVLVGKLCVGYSLRPRSYSISAMGRRSARDDDVRADGDSVREDHDESPLIALHEATTELMRAETTDEILTIVLDAVDEILRLPAAAIYLWDDQVGVLRPHEATDGTRALFGELPTFDGPDSLAWDAFVDGEFRAYDDVKRRQNRYNSETVIEAELFAPLGEHGLLIAGAKESDALDEVDIKATQTLAANTVTALDLIDRKRQLTHQRERLRQQNDQLVTLKRINSVIRDIGHITVTSSTRSEIERTICEKLTAIDPYRFAWIGRYDREEGIRARQWSGTNGEFLDHLCESIGDSSERTPPAERALRTGDVQVTQNIFADEAFAPWRKPALNRGFQSAISLPLSYEQTEYGVLEIYAAQSNAFRDEEREAFAELGNMIANAFRAIERKQALLSDTRTELELRMSGQNDVFSRAARKANGEIELDTVVPRDDGTWLLYLTATGVDSSAASAALRGFTIVESAQRIGGRDETDLFGVVLTEFELGELLANHVSKLEKVRATPDETAIVVSVPKEADVRAVVTACQNRYPDIELARRNSDVDETALERKMREVESLTDKQREALEVALNHGFFAWPRDKTGEEIADLLDVTPPTFHRHVRMGLEVLLRETLGRRPLG